MKKYFLNLVQADINSLEDKLKEPRKYKGLHERLEYAKDCLERLQRSNIREVKPKEIKVKKPKVEVPKPTKHLRPNNFGGAF